MPLSAAVLQGLFAANTDLVPLVLVTLDHPDMVEPIRVVRNTAAITSRGETYEAAWFRPELPLDSGEELAQVRLEVDNVDRTLVAELRGLDSPPTVTLEVVTSADPDTVELGPFAFELQDAEYDTLVVRGTLAYEDILNEGFPAGTYNPRDFPGLFA